MTGSSIHRPNHRSNQFNVMAASRELDVMQQNSSTHGMNFMPFPPACFSLVRSLPGNQHCIDCDAPNPDWASVTYGCLLCLNCSGKHRSFGVKTSFVRSLTMDEWSHSQVLAMLEGGNQQLTGFFARHQMVADTTGKRGTGIIISKRYQTKAARFYRTNLTKHINKVSVAGVYLGREASRLSKTNQEQQHQKKLDPSKQQQKQKLKSKPIDVTKTLTNVTNASIHRRSILSRQLSLVMQ